MKLADVLGCKEGLQDAVSELPVADISSNSQEVTGGALFFGLPGTKVDGASFARQAEQNGAIAVVVSEQSEVEALDIPVVRVANIRQVLANSAARFAGSQPQTMAAVTGTAGKTSVATFLRQIWTSAGFKAASIGTTGVVAPGLEEYGNLTTPDPVSLHKLLAMLAGDGVTHASMEASSHGLDQHRVDGVKLSAAAFTNLGRDHMDYHPTVDDYLDAKLLLFRERIDPGTPAIVFSDDEFSGAVIDASSAAGNDVRTVGRKGDFICLKKVEHLKQSQVIELEHGGEFYRVELPLAGDFQVSNALVASGLAISTGVEAGTAFAALETLQGASGRLELVAKDQNGVPVYVDYAHKPDALENVLKSLRPFTPGRIVVVFGCGGDRDRGKRPIMGEIAARLSDIAIVTDDNPRSEDPAAVRSEIVAACPGAIEIGDRKEAIHHAIQLLENGDCLVVAGKGHEEGQIVGSKVLPFSDHQVVREAIGGVRDENALDG